MKRDGVGKWGVWFKLVRERILKKCPLRSDLKEVREPCRHLGGRAFGQREQSRQELGVMRGPSPGLLAGVRCAARRERTRRALSCLRFTGSLCMWGHRVGAGRP